jgi:DNA-binding transcriptional LysR family regulator
MAFLEGHVGMQLLHRTTRSSKLSEVGERYAAACRRVLTDLDEVEFLAASEKSAPGGTLSVTAPVLGGEEMLRPILDDFLDAFPTVAVKVALLDQQVNLIEEGMDIALRIGHLPDSSMVAVRVGEVRRVVVAAPSYLAKHPDIEEPGDLANHRIISFCLAGPDAWTFPGADGSMVPRSVQVMSRFIVNSARAAVASATDGRGVTRLYSSQVAEQVRDGSLRIILQAHEFAPVPVHLIMPEGRISIPKVRAFVDFVVPRLRSQFSRLAIDSEA